MRLKFLFLFAFLLALTGIAKSADSLDLEVVWQKEVFPKEIKFANFSADGEWIYAVTNVGIEKISVATGVFSSTFSGDGTVSGFYDMDISVLGNLITTYNGSGAVNIWDTKNEKIIKTISYVKKPGYDGIRAIAISPDEKYLALGVNENINSNNENWFLIIYDLILDKEIHKFPYDIKINKIKFSHNGKYFALGGYYHNDLQQKYYDQVTLWDTGTWKQVAEIENLVGENGGYRWIKFSKDDKYVGVVRAIPYDVRIYSIETKNLIFSNPFTNRLYEGIEFLPDNSHFLISWGKWSGEYGFELYDFNGKINDFNIPSNNIESFDSTGIWKIFFVANEYPMTLMTQKTVGVENPKIDIQTINILVQNNSIILETKNILEKHIYIEIFDLRGKSVFQQSIDNPISNSKIPLNAVLLSGIYIVQVKVDNRKFSKKIEIVR